MKYICQICGYVYDDEKEKVPFDQLPDDWKCPLCGAAKSNFKAEEVKAEAPKAEVKAKEAVTAKTESAGVETAEDLRELSAGQLAALCSNLARGCEKQYKTEEAELFTKLAEYFTAAVPAINDATVEKLAADLQKDVDHYADVRQASDDAGDRGAARVCVWGEKVTRMLSSLVERYLKEGEAMLEGTSIWVCSVCGFVYIGDAAPELCPVCKVPAWKFDKIEGRA